MRLRVHHRDPKDTRRARSLCTVEEGGRAGHACRKPAVTIYRRKADGFEALRCRYHERFMGSGLVGTGKWQRIEIGGAAQARASNEPEAGR